MSERRLLVVGWQGADWHLLRPLLDAGKLPHLWRLVSKGAASPLLFSRPLHDAVTWTTLATGKPPLEHGVLGDLQPDGRGDVCPVARPTRRAPTFWEVAAASGVPSVAIGFPATHPAAVAIDNLTVVTDRFGPRRRGQAGDRDAAACSPRQLARVLDPLRLSADELFASELREFVPNLADVDLQRDPRPARLAESLSAAATTHNVATRLADGPWRLLAVRYDWFGPVLHRFLRYQAPTSPAVSEADATRYGAVCEAAAKLQDQMLGVLVRLAGDETNVVVVSNHGFRQSPQGIFPSPLEGRPDIDPDTAARLDDRLRRHNPLRRHREVGVLVGVSEALDLPTDGDALSSLDVAPTVLGLLGLRSDAMPGRPLLSKAVGERLKAASPAPVADANDGWLAQELLDDLMAVGAATIDRQASAAIELARQHWLLSEGAAATVAGDGDHALVAYRRLHERDDSLFARAHVIEALLDCGEADEAEQMLQAARSITAGAVVFDVLRARLAQVRGDLHDAVAILRRACDAEPGVTELWFRLADACTAAGDASATAALSRAAALDPEDRRAATRLSDTGGA